MVAVVQKKGGYEIVKEGREQILKIDANKWPFSPSIEDNQYTCLR